ncbi:MAG: alpha/beta fold hydrolase [Thermodesulfobacteriota bacterium]|nr:alpha/beta fold hydrolase [Thermodesulfobacteriota bacterium]
MNKPSKVNVFCLPFAGGAFYSYNGLQRCTPAFINTVSVDLPGHGKRIGEPLLANIHEMADDVFQQIKNDLDEPYAIYGHSMGATLGYLVAQRLEGANMPKPLHLFFTGRQGPPVESKEKDAYMLPKERFIQRLKEYDGIPDEVLRENELMDFFEPVLRADFQAIGTYQYEDRPPLDIPVTVIIGLDDNTTYEEALTWQKVTTRQITIRQFPGGHFFIFDHLHEISQIISRNLWESLANALTERRPASPLKQQTEAPHDTGFIHPF